MSRRMGRGGRLAGLAAALAAAVMAGQAAAARDAGGTYVVYRGEYYSNRAGRAAADRVALGWGAEVAGIDFPLARGGGAITGIVVAEGSGAPLAGVLIQATADLGDDWTNFWAAAFSGENGTYRLEGLPPHPAYHVAAHVLPEDGLNRVGEYYRNRTAPSADPVAVHDGQETSAIDFDLPVGGIILGRVVRAAGGAPIPDCYVFAYSQAQAASGYAVTDASGSYAIRGLAPGDYAVYVYDLDWELVNHYYRNRLDLAHADLVPVVAGDDPPPGQRGIDFALPTGGRISGTVYQSAPGRPCADWWVTAVLQGGSSYARFGPTAAGGGYTIPGLPTGDYLVIVSQIPAYQNPVHVTAPQETSPIDFWTCPDGAGTGEIRGRVVEHGTSTGLADLPVQAFALAGGHDSQATCTDSNGRYRICNLYPGIYAVRVTAPQTRWVAEYYNGEIELAAAGGVPVEADELVASIDFGLRRGGRIEGRAFDEVFGIDLASCPIEIDYGSSTPLQAVLLWTGEDGRYRCEFLDSGGLPPRDYYVRADPFSAWFETAAATPTPSPTPPAGTTATPTPDAAPVPTPDPNDCSATGVRIWMPSQHYRPGDPCAVAAVVCNAGGAPLAGYPLFVVLDVYGSYFFGPGFAPALDHYLAAWPEFAPGVTLVPVVPEFAWPAGAGAATGILWHGALTNPAMTELAGAYGWFEFGWGP